MTDIVKHSEYRDWLYDLKQQIKTGQVKAALSVNSQMIMLYWDLGRQIVEKQEKAQWGSGFIEQLSKKIKDINQALFYINKTIENNWSRAVLEYQIETNLYERQ
jgi:predicted nuclease of restriction endonuclease-like (RecB) superfamily